MNDFFERDFAFANVSVISYSKREEVEKLIIFLNSRANVTKGNCAPPFVVVVDRRRGGPAAHAPHTQHIDCEEIYCDRVPPTTTSTTTTATTPSDGGRKEEDDEITFGPNL